MEGLLYYIVCHYFLLIEMKHLLFGPTLMYNEN